MIPEYPLLDTGKLNMCYDTYTSTPYQMLENSFSEFYDFRVGPSQIYMWMTEVWFLQHVQTNERITSYHD